MPMERERSSNFPAGGKTLLMSVAPIRAVSSVFEGASAAASVSFT